MAVELPTPIQLIADRDVSKGGGLGGDLHCSLAADAD
jgi:hypothetical protein